jgi:HPt (histidine-containing phosphotransfer) domain-containing protein
VPDDTAPIWDRESLLENLGGDPEILAEILGLFIEDSTRLLGELREAVGRGDRARVAKLAHTLKGSTANCQATACSQAALGLEQAARSAGPGASPDGAASDRPGSDDVDRSADELVEALARLADEHARVMEAMGPYTPPAS